MPSFAGIDHLSLSVNELDESQHFYIDVLDFMLLVDFGEVRVLLDRPTGFTLSLVRHSTGRRGPFSELNPGLDHVGLTASTRDELVEWERRFETAGVVYTPIRDMPFGSHLNFRDPDGIPAGVHGAQRRPHRMAARGARARRPAGRDQRSRSGTPPGQWRARIRAARQQGPRNRLRSTTTCRDVMAGYPCHVKARADSLSRAVRWSSFEWRRARRNALGTASERVTGIEPASSAWKA